MFECVIAKFRVKSHTVTLHWIYREGTRGMVLSVINLGARWEWGVSATFRPVYPREGEQVTISQEATLVWKISTPQGLEPRILLPVESCDTDYTITALVKCVFLADIVT
jgi:hypothetical protein